MAIQVTTIRKILDGLNGTGKDTPWAVLPESYVLTAVSISSPTQINPSGNGIIVKAFINMETGEIKTYIAKWLDTPENNLLP